MKTPMQQMLELLEELLDSKPTRADRSRFEIAISKAKELIEEERKVIDTVYTAGATKGVEFERGNQNNQLQEWPDGFGYYNEIFNNEEE
jgi:hypothetical protein